MNESRNRSAWAVARRLGTLLLVVASCSSSAPNLSLLGPDQLLERGLERAANRKWDDAIRALEQFIFQYPTHPRYQEARFRLGEVYLGKREYLTAASEFGRLASDFPSGPWADDARFKVCEAYQRLSPKPVLDQQYTVDAIQHCSSLVATYPDSEFAPRARTIITELENKLAEKLFLSGDFYYRGKAYDSAILELQRVLEAYPTSAIAPRALLLLYQSFEKIGYTEEANQARERLIREYPDSPEAKRLKGVSVVPRP